MHCFTNTTFACSQPKTRLHSTITTRDCGLWAGRACFWNELPGRLPLLGKSIRAMGGPGCKKVARVISNVESVRNNFFFNFMVTMLKLG